MSRFARIGLAMFTFLAHGVAFDVLAPASALAQADHLQCHKVTDANKFKFADVTLTAPQVAFQMPANCVIKGKAKRFCVPVSKTVIDTDAPVPEFVPPTVDAAGDYVCYRLKCPKTEIADQPVTDQFGARDLQKLKTAGEICVPAVKGTYVPFTLDVIASGAGSGSVTSSPPGINCGATCSAAFDAGVEVTLTATADAGSVFTGWSGGGCSGTGTCVVTMNDDVSVTATFTPEEFTLTVTRAGTGTGNVTSMPAGINCGADCNESYSSGTMVALTASPSMGSTFAGWSGGGCSGTGTCVVTMTSATAVTATFVLDSFTLTVARAGTGTGTVTSTPAGINCGADCNESYPSGTMVTLTASSSMGSTFTGWSGGGCSGTGTCVVTMTSATAVTATFTLQSFTLTVSRAGAGTGNVTSTPAGINCGADCNESYSNGTMVTLTATPTSGSFAGWSGGGCSGTGTCVVTMTAPASVTATFSP